MKCRYHLQITRPGPAKGFKNLLKCNSITFSTLRKQTLLTQQQDEEGDAGPYDDDGDDGR